MISTLSIDSVFAQQTVTVATGGIGWKRVAVVLANGGRSFGRLSIFTTGGDHTPVMTTINWYHDWNINGGISIQTDSKASGYWSQFRLTDDGTNAYIEVNFAVDVSALAVMLDEYSWRAATVYTGTLPDGGGTVRAVADRGRFNIENLFVVGHDGNVGIGTPSSTSKLSVNGQIRAKEIKVEALNWPDYVFAKGYQLSSLQETEKHIKEKGHLPGIPSAAEVETNGVDLGDMNKKLLKKIEELTLHLIEMKKTMSKQSDLLSAQQKQINKMKQIN